MKRCHKLIAAFAAKNAGRVAACALLVGASSALALDPTGVIATFDVATAGDTIRTIMLTVLAILGTVYGCALGFVFLRWVYRKVVGALAGAK